jgi:Lrp/AsnC family transcriptional regulator
MHSELDSYDRRILALLQEDASLSSAQIAEQVGCRSRRAGGGFSG